MELKPEYQNMDRQQIEAHLKSRAASDPEFRKALVSDPRATLAKETGLELPREMKVQVIEESSDSMCLVLPPAAGELSDMELESVAGGSAKRQNQKGPIPFKGRMGGGGRVIGQDASG